MPPKKKGGAGAAKKRQEEAMKAERAKQLLTAVYERDPMKIRVLVMIYNVDPNHRAADRWTPLLIAARMGCEKTVGALLEWQADVNLTDGPREHEEEKKPKKGQAAAAKKGRVGSGKGVPNVLLKYGDRPPAVPRYVCEGGTALHVAALKRREKVAEALCQHKGVMLDKHDYQGRTPLMLAAQVGSVPICKALLEAKADATLKDKHGRTPYFLAAIHGSADVCHLFVQLGVAHQDQRDKEGETVVDVFRRRPSRTQIKCLPPVTTDTQDSTFLKMAISSRDDRAAQPLVSRGVRAGEPLLECAHGIAQGKFPIGPCHSILHMLLENKSDPSVRDPTSRQTALHLLCGAAPWPPSKVEAADRRASKRVYEALFWKSRVSGAHPPDEPVAPEQLRITDPFPPGEEGMFAEAQTRARLRLVISAVKLLVAANVNVGIEDARGLTALEYLRQDVDRYGSRTLLAVLDPDDAGSESSVDETRTPRARGTLRDSQLERAGWGSMGSGLDGTLDGALEGTLGGTLDGTLETLLDAAPAGKRPTSATSLYASGSTRPPSAASTRFSASTSRPQSAYRPGSANASRPTSARRRLQSTEPNLGEEDDEDDGTPV